jgi:hypothetical protein
VAALPAQLGTINPNPPFTNCHTVFPIASEKQVRNIRLYKCSGYVILIIGDFLPPQGVAGKNRGAAIGRPRSSSCLRLRSSLQLKQLRVPSGRTLCLARGLPFRNPWAFLRWRSGSLCGCLSDARTRLQPANIRAAAGRTTPRFPMPPREQITETVVRAGSLAMLVPLRDLLPMPNDHGFLKRILL